jgi:glutamate 5-kinase
MLKQRELAFIKAISNSKVSTVFLRELRSVVAAKKKKASGAPSANGKLMSSQATTARLSQQAAALRPSTV